MNEPEKYDRIGVGYSNHRRADPRLVDAIVNILGLTPEGAIADVGAGSGSYSRALADAGFDVKAVEPSSVMRGQAARHPRVEWFTGAAEAIPLADDSVRGAVCILAWHHFQSTQQAALEVARISSGPIVIFTYDPRAMERFWLTDYFPELFSAGYRAFPPLAAFASLFDSTGRSMRSSVFKLPWDLEDHFLAACWRRPQMYLDPEIRACMSAFASEDPSYVQPRIDQLRGDLESGTWQQRYGSILGLQDFDAGYRFIRVGPVGD